MWERSGLRSRRLEICAVACAMVLAAWCTASAGAAGKAPRGGAKQAKDLLARLLADPEAKAEEIVFAVRGASRGHWYETFGRDAKMQAWRYGQGGGRR